MIAKGKVYDYRIRRDSTNYKQFYSNRGKAPKFWVAAGGTRYPHHIAKGKYGIRTHTPHSYDATHPPPTQLHVIDDEQKIQIYHTTVQLPNQAAFQLFQFFHSGIDLDESLKMVLL